MAASVAPAVLAVGLLLTAGAAAAWHGQVEAGHQAAFDAEADRTTDALIGGLDEHVAVLAGVRGLFGGSEHVTADEFATYVDGLDLGDDLPGLAALAFVQRVASGDLDAYRAEHGTGPEDDGGDGPHHLLTYAAGAPDRLWPRGTDLAADPHARPALEGAWTGGDARGWVPPQRPGTFVLALPVRPATGPEDRPPQVGWALAGLDVDAFLAGRTASAAGDRAEAPAEAVTRVALRVQGPGPDAPAVSAAHPPALPAGSGDRHEAAAHRDAFGLTWSFSYQSLPGRFDPADRWGVWLVAAVGLAMSGLGFGFVRVLVRSERTARRRVDEATRELRQANAFLDAVLEHIPLVVSVKDADSLRYVRVNRAAEAFLDRPREELVGTRLGDVLPGEAVDRLEAEDREVVAAGEPITSLHRFQPGPDEEPRWLRVRKVPVPGEDGTPRYVLSIAEDITEQRRLQELERRRSASAARSEELERMTELASHSLKEPLRNIKSFVQLVDRDLPEGARDAVGEHLGYVRAGVLQLERVLRDYVAFAEAATRPLHVDPVAADRAVEEALADLRDEVRARDAEVTVDDLPRVLADEKRLCQVFHHLLHNALVHGGGEAAPRVHVGARVPGPGTDAAGEGHCVLFVEDQGPGIAPRYQDRIFDLFEQLEPGKTEGSGLGLALCRVVVERHGGAIWVESKEDEGTTVCFSLMAAREAAGDAQAGDRGGDRWEGRRFGSIEA